MDSDPEPRSSASAASLASAQADDTPEEPPNPFQSAAFVLGPLIGVLTLVVPFASVIVDRSGFPELPSLSARSDRSTGGLRAPRPPVLPSAEGLSAEVASPAAGPPPPTALPDGSVPGARRSSVLAPAAAAGRPRP